MTYYTNVLRSNQLSSSHRLFSSFLSIVNDCQNCQHDKDGIAQSGPSVRYSKWFSNIKSCCFVGFSLEFWDCFFQKKQKRRFLYELNTEIVTQIKTWMTKAAVSHRHTKRFFMFLFSLLFSISAQ